MPRRLVRTLATLLSISLPVACGSAEPDEFDELLESGESQYARFKEEPIVRHFFRDRGNGFFVDIGCYKPVEFNVTNYLEQHLGWSGIAVDAQRQLAPLWKKSRPRSKFFAYAVTDQSGKTITFHEAGPISSTEMDIIEFWGETRGKKIPVRDLEVPTITIDDLLEAEGIEHIDFLKIDINGTEPTALAGFDIKRYRPELVHVEAHAKNHESLMKYFEENDYERIDAYLKYDQVNWYFTPAR
jgi:FkbM family methyltransferase